MPEIAAERYRRQVPLSQFTTLRAGGPAERLVIARSVDEIAEVALESQRNQSGLTCLGWGSNVLPSDDGVPGLTVINGTRDIFVSRNGEVTADCGANFQELFLKTVQAGLGGLEFAVGIPGTVGGALVSNAGAYRSNISEFLTEIELVMDGRRAWHPPSVMQFSYRDSLLRRADPPPCVLLRIRLKLPAGDMKESYDEAREYQRQRIGKQPAPASAGSFFKNVTDPALAARIESLPARIRDAGVVPAGYLIEACGLRGARLGGAQIGQRHANFLLNVGRATATELRSLADHARARVQDTFGVELEEEVLYLGNWSRYEPIPFTPSQS